MIQQHPYQETFHQTEEENFSFRQLLSDWRKSLLFALGFWKIILLVTLVGGVLGFAYARWRKVTYTARLTFIVEEAKASGGSLASAVAGQFGFDIGNLAGGNGILAGDNVLELLKSRTFVKSALLTPYADSASSHSLADQYATVYGWKERWADDSKVGRVVDFPTGSKSLTRLEDSLLQIIIKRVVEKELSIAKPDKKLSLFNLEVTTRDERLSQLLCTRLLNIATDFYVETKTKRLSNNVARLQRRADSLGGLLDRKTYSSVEAERLLLDANPAYSSQVATVEISSRNKFIQSTVYGEIIKNLEVSRTALSQETPTVQTVDLPEMPLKKNKTSMLLNMLGGAIAGMALCTLLFATLYRKQPSITTGMK